MLFPTSAYYDDIIGEVDKDIPSGFPIVMNRTAALRFNSTNIPDGFMIYEKTGFIVGVSSEVMNTTFQVSVIDERTIIVDVRIIINEQKIEKTSQPFYKNIPLVAGVACAIVVVLVAVITGSCFIRRNRRRPNTRKKAIGESSSK